jgi:hypothetical protein
MPDEILDEALEPDDSLTMEVMGIIPMYGTIEGADRYFSEQLYGEFWETQTAEKKQKALITATRAIDLLNFAGSKTDDSQVLEFPRNGDTEVAEAIQRASYEEALARLRGIDPVTEAGNLHVSARVFGKLRTDYDNRSAPQHITHGIASYAAWKLVLPYLAQARGVKLRRGS